VVAPPTTVCDPGSGDACDPDETCTGTAGDPCPSDVVQPPSFVCRPAAGLCDAPDNCPGVPAGTCAADAKQPSGTPCRPATGVCDIAEACNGTSDNCPADALQPDGTSCTDGLFCNGAETCQAGSCADGADPCTFVCSEGTDMCLTDACPAAPQGGCRTSAKKLLMVKNKVDDNKDKLIWKFIKGDQTTQTEFGDPTATAAYALCIYSGASLRATLGVAPGPNWTAIGDKGYKYKDQTYAQDGVGKIIVKGGGPGKTKALVKGKGVNLPSIIDSAGLGTNVTAQLLNHQSGVCWEATFTAPKKDTTALYKATQ
jgi:hypothetical protein